MNRKEIITIELPTQYKMLEYCELTIICPIKEMEIAIDDPTVATNGVVSSIAYVQQ
jgi:hypothetical protein